MLKNALQGYNGTIMCYGQTGAAGGGGGEDGGEALGAIESYMAWAGIGGEGER